MVEDGIHLSDNRTHIFAENFEEFLRNFIFEAYKNVGGNRVNSESRILRITIVDQL